MERLGHLINQSVTTSEWRPFRFIRNGIPVSHLFFADDLILYAAADTSQASLIQSVLATFGAFFGHCVNRAKTQIYFSPNTHTSLQDDISFYLGYQRVECLGKYLGVPVLHARMRCSDYNFIIDKIKEKLSGWASRTLSLAGRVTLAKFVLSAIPVYFIQTSLLPKRICAEIEKLIRKFIWGSTENASKASLVNWESICQPLDHGGLGFRRIHDFNVAFVLKICFAIVSEIHALWIRLLR
ncbi:hypothetical protein like AT3G24255 [Hibiscus trionum]|uniref:Reverse transcriptase n=1 Tax=Hibiscus trionum TaxID=183268 RepID=A0A9W7I6N1_HIBTR|nr:hypothetical protein like AT3G24255 [Hibiscus trionum]